jgi:hypothetical protein
MTYLHTCTKVLLILNLCILSLACSTQVEEMSFNQTTDQKSDHSHYFDEDNQSSTDEPIEWAPPRVGDGLSGGYELISALIPAGCMAYKVSENTMITTALCLAECIYENCDVAIMTSGTDPVYLGLASKLAVSSTRASELTEGIGIVYFNTENTASKYVIEDQQYGQVTILGENKKIDWIDWIYGYIQPTNESCPAASVAIMNDHHGLIGLSFGRRGECDQFLFLSAFSDFLREAHQENYVPTLPDQDIISETTDETDSNLSREDDERHWAEEEFAALSRASDCDSQGDKYCDGDIEMYCMGSSYKAFHCGRVGWSCRDNSTWGPSCEP